MEPRKFTEESYQESCFLKVKIRLITEVQLDICYREFQLCWEYYDIIFMEWQVRIRAGDACFMLIVDFQIYFGQSPNI